MLLIYSHLGCMTAEGGSHGNTLVVPCQWFITLCMMPVSSESVDWKDRKSQECAVAIRNQNSPSWLRGIKLLLSLFSENLKGQRSALVDFCVGGYLT